MADLFEDYRLGPGWDEMFAAPGLSRPSYEAIYSTLQPLSSADLRVRAEVLARAFLEQGVTFALKDVERPFSLDLVPRVVSAAEWSQIERGWLSGSARWKPSSPTSTAAATSSTTA